MTFKDVSSIEHEVWAVCTDGTLYRRLGVTAENPTGSVWQRVHSGPTVHVTARGSLLE